MNLGELAFQGMEEEGTLGRWSKQGVGPEEWLVTGELAEVWLH